MASPPRYRPIRGTLWGLYLALAFGFCGLIIAGVMYGVLSERKLAPVEPGGASDPAVCASELGQIYAEVHRELDAQRAQLGGSDASAGQSWAALRARLLALGTRCGLEGRPGRDSAMGRAYEKVVALQRLSESAAVQYRHEVGPTDADARRLLEQAGVHLAGP